MLADYENCISSKAGKAYLTSHAVMHKQDVHNDLTKMDWLDHWFFSALGRKIEKRYIEAFRFLFINTSYPDVSIWPNYVAGLAATTRASPATAFSISSQFGESGYYGRRPERRGIEFFYRLDEALDCGISFSDFIDQELKERKTIPGYGRPLYRSELDERVPHCIDKFNHLGILNEKFIRYAIVLHRHLKQRKNIFINVGGLFNALGAQAGLSAIEHSMIANMAFVGGSMAVYSDQIKNEEGTVTPVRCNSIVCENFKKRTW